MLRLKKKQFFTAELSHCRRNVRKTWDTLNDLLGRPSQQSLDEKLIRAFPHELPQDIANSFNVSFAASIGKLKQNAPNPHPGYIGMPLLNSAFLPSTDTDELRTVLASLSAHRPLGCDKIRVRDLQNNFNKIKKVTALYSEWLHWNWGNTCRIEDLNG